MGTTWREYGGHGDAPGWGHHPGDTLETPWRHPGDMGTPSWGHPRDLGTPLLSPWQHFGDTPGTGTLGTRTPGDILGSGDDGDTLRRPQVRGRGKHHTGNILGTPLGMGTWGHSPEDTPMGQGGQCQHGGRGTENTQSMQPLKVGGTKMSGRTEGHWGTRKDVRGGQTHHVMRTGGTRTWGGLEQG